MQGLSYLNYNTSSPREKSNPELSGIDQFAYGLGSFAGSVGFFSSQIKKDIEQRRVRKPNIADLLYEHKIDFIINVPSTSTLEKYVRMLYDEYKIRRKAVELGIPVLITTEIADSFAKTLEWLRHNETTKKPLESYEIIE